MKIKFLNAQDYGRPFIQTTTMALDFVLFTTQLQPRDTPNGHGRGRELSLQISKSKNKDVSDRSPLWPTNGSLWRKEGTDQSEL